MAPRKRGKQRGKQEKEKEQQEDREKRREYIYEDIHPRDKCEFIINSDSISTYDSYLQTITWIRCKGCQHGTKFGGIPNLTPVDTTHPLMEVNVMYEEFSQDYSVKFLILKSTLYVIGFIITPQLRYSYEGYDIRGFQLIQGHSGRYSNETLEAIILGPGKMMEILRDLHSDTHPLEKATSAEVFFIHLSESARFELIRVLVSKKIIKDADYLLEPPEVRPRINFKNRDGEFLEPDVFELMQETHHLNVNELPMAENICIANIIRNHDNLCAAWYTFVMSGYVASFLDPNDVSICRVGSTATLKSILGVLKNFGEMDFTSSLVTKAEVQEFIDYTPQIHDQVVARLAQLKGEAFFD